MSQLEFAARLAWIEWGDGYALFGLCAACDEVRHVRGKRRSWMLCLECFDLAGPRVRRTRDPATQVSANGRSAAREEVG